ncbi:hypothetical protein TGRH88_026360 [Toxoplasma gondii]|uniref:Uncharacterized protein n=1 Tax=Toxoplasma gondii TaxID=5811 RepID=A0A7J6KAD8_TOXGO|nr:hypothetical protein TGRH88_026360 [Toxoplasma gondii]
MFSNGKSTPDANAAGQLWKSSDADGDSVPLNGSLARRVRQLEFRIQPGDVGSAPKKRNLLCLGKVVESQMRFFCIKFIIGMHFLCGGQGERRTVSLIYRKGVLQCTTSRASGRSEAAKLLHHLLQASYCLEQFGISLCRDTVTQRTVR